MSNTKRKGHGLTLSSRKMLVGWGFILPAAILLLVFSFYPMFRAIMLSFQRGKGQNVSWYGLGNYTRILKDKTFRQAMFNTFFYLIIQVPLMLFLALILASLLNNKDIRGKAIFRTMIFLPCATSLVSYSMIFRSIFSMEGLINMALTKLHLPAVGWFQNAWAARIVIIIALIWRWTGYNMVFYLAGLQNIDYALYESARLDGCTFRQAFYHITIPLLRPTILLTTIMSINGTLQLFDESMNLTSGGPGISTISMSHYIYNTSFVQNPNFYYSSALSVVILIMVAVLSAIQMKVGDKRD